MTTLSNYTPEVWSYDYLGLSHQVIKLVAVD